MRHAHKELSPEQLFQDFMDVPGNERIVVDPALTFSRFKRLSPVCMCGYTGGGFVVHDHMKSPRGEGTDGHRSLWVYDPVKKAYMPYDSGTHGNIGRMYTEGDVVYSRSTPTKVAIHRHNGDPPTGQQEEVEVVFRDRTPADSIHTTMQEHITRAA